MAEARRPRARKDIAGFIGIAGPYDFLPIKDTVINQIFAGVDLGSTQPINFIAGGEPPTNLFLPFVRCPRGQFEFKRWARERRQLANRLKTSRSFMRLAMAAFYISAGVAHMIFPDKFAAIVPGWVPYPRPTVFLTGICEIAGGIGLVTRRFRRLAGGMLALYAICVFPANLDHAVHEIDLPPVPNSWWYHGPRLAFQPILVWWALFCSDTLDWPFKSKSSEISK